ncbi:hypothetical protein CC80DRAFT_267125 [Byssothecium circinans]|uniref:Homeobox domain-containing protein n=1 Tax=Byssothecium circinans TaxID=147558 RepID=A0A6A5UDB9_9PLEO|nr:hypothetical protein CC80DRAFT_267125 [Byssothecium circinans]
MEYLTLQDIPHRHNYHSRRMASPDAPRAGSQLPGMAQSHHMRNSPPFQPGEQRPSNTLPSFSQLMQNVREPSPPRTPSRKNVSMESSPVSRTHFDEVAWESDSKHRRTDTASSSTSAYSAYDPRHPTAVEATARAQQAAYPHHYHRPSLPYATPPPAGAVTGHARHHSASVVHASHAAGYPYHHGHSAPTAHYAAPHQAAAYEHRGSYYPEPHYEHQDPYYASVQPYMSAPPPGYEIGYHPQVQPYNNYTFQATMSADQNSFSNRKRRGNLPKEATTILKNWYAAHQDSPYPSEDEKNELVRSTMLTMNQVSNWFINARRRFPGKEGREQRGSVGHPRSAE